MQICKIPGSTNSNNYCSWSALSFNSFVALLYEYVDYDFN